MLKDKLLPISIFCLAGSIIISGFLISIGIDSNGSFIGSKISQGSNTISNNINNGITDGITDGKNEKNNLNLGEAAKYLGISEAILIRIIYNEESKIPYVQVEGHQIFNKDALDKWIGESRFKM